MFHLRAEPAGSIEIARCLGDLTCSLEMGSLPVLRSKLQAVLQHAKKVVSDSPGVVDFAPREVNLGYFLLGSPHAEPLPHYSLSRSHNRPHLSHFREKKVIFAVPTYSLSVYVSTL